MILVAIDPGIHTGWARFSHGRLSSCGLGTPPIAGPALAAATDVVIEKPEYRKFEKVNPNDLITLAIRVGKHAARAEAEGISVTYAKPSEWKGSVPKAIHGPRILAALSPEEKDLFDRIECAKSLRHNVVDAIGLGIWFLGRGA